MEEKINGDMLGWREDEVQKRFKTERRRKKWKEYNCCLERKGEE